ncbi:MAG: hypothetical protein GKS00_12550 [Alphaproteobacteria bacterium]|nr:hypothetical protein [Alphaproteobacteria bacterium]
MISSSTTFKTSFAFAAVLLLSACTVKSGDANGISIEYTTRQFGVAEWTAKDHCAKFSKRAVLARKGPKQSNYGLVPQTNVAEFDCIK